MSKKKNTLKDLDEFLKQQAASLVIPEAVPDEKPKNIAPETTPDPVITTNTTQDVYDTLINLAQQDPESFRQKLYALIVQILEAQPASLPEDKMLINTALYLKSGEHWQEAIREYWTKRIH